MNMISTNDTTQAKESIKVDDLKSSLLSLYPTGIYEKLFEQIKKELVQTRIHNNCIVSLMTKFKSGHLFIRTITILLNLTLLTISKTIMRSLFL